MTIRQLACIIEAVQRGRRPHSTHQPKHNAMDTTVNTTINTLDEAAQDTATCDPDDTRNRMVQAVDEELYSALRKFVLVGTEPAGAARALVANDLADFAKEATHNQLREMKLFVDYVERTFGTHREAPHGSPHAVDAWVMQGGLWGHYCDRFSTKREALEYYNQAAELV